MRISSAVSLSRNWTTVTCSATFARSIADSSPELPPPTTATFFPAKRGASQVEQYATPFPVSSFSPGTLSFLELLPVVTMRAF